MSRRIHPVYPHEAKASDDQKEILRRLARSVVGQIRHGATKDAFLIRGWVKPDEYGPLRGFTLTSIGCEAAGIPYLFSPLSNDIEVLGEYVLRRFSDEQIADLVAYLFSHDARSGGEA